MSFQIIFWCLGLMIGFLEIFAIVIYCVTKINGTRLNWFEIHDNDKCPSFLRQIAQDILRSGWESFGLASLVGSPADSVADVLISKLKQLKISAIVDLCSGGGGPSPYINGKINKARTDNTCNITTVLTDLYPHTDSWKVLSEKYKFITYCPQSTDATNVSLTEIDCMLDANSIDSRCGGDKIRRMRTLFECFHHFSQFLAVGIISDAMKHGDSFFMCEMGINRDSLFDFIKFPILFIVSAPLIILDLTKRYWQDSDSGIFTKVFKSVRLILTYPFWLFIMTHDGIISNGRSYLQDELLEFTQMAYTQASKDIDKIGKNKKMNDYQWNVMKVVPNMSGPFKYLSTMTILIGVPQLVQKS